MSNPWEATELFGKMLGEYTDNGYRQGVYEERERIIALLETLNIHCIDCMSEQFDELGLPKAEYTIDRLIALIKGENK